MRTAPVFFLHINTNASLKASRVGFRCPLKALGFPSRAAISRAQGPTPPQPQPPAPSPQPPAPNVLLPRLMLGLERERCFRALSLLPGRTRAVRGIWGSSKTAWRSTLPF